MSAKSSIVLVGCLFIISVFSFVSSSEVQHSDLPPPPAKPDKFTTKQQLKDYLVKLHEYYAIIGRPRFGRSFQMPSERELKSSIDMNADGLNSDEFTETTSVPKIILSILDQNQDGYVSKQELNDFLRVYQRLRN